MGDFIVGYSQFSSAQHPSAGYSVHLASDGAGTIRETFGQMEEAAKDALSHRTRAFEQLKAALL